MKTLEERLRAAIHETAEEITPGSVPPLRLRSARHDERAASARVDGRRAGRWLAPACAAAAVIAIASGSVVIGAPGNGRPAGRHQAVVRHQADPRDVLKATRSVPQYYVALELTGRGMWSLPPVTEAVVRATASGTALAKIVPPQPYGTFTLVTAAADDRTFVLAAKKLFLPRKRTDPLWDVTGFFLLRIDPASRIPGGRARLTPLPVRLQPTSAQATEIALSPDATKLAVGVGPSPSIHVFSLATGADRVWKGPPSGGRLSDLGPHEHQGSLSWTMDGRTLAFIWMGGQNDTARPGVRLLNTAVPGTSLLASSRLAAPIPSAIPRVDDLYWRQAIVVGDGKTIIAVVDVPGPRHPRSNYGWEFTEFSARTGKVLRTLSHIPFYAADLGYEWAVLWASPSGDVLIVAGSWPPAKGTSFQPGGVTGVGVFSHGRFTPIPWSERTFAVAW